MSRGGTSRDNGKVSSNSPRAGSPSTGHHDGTKKPTGPKQELGEPHQWTPAGPDEELKIKVEFLPEWLKDEADLNTATNSGDASPKSPKGTSSQTKHSKRDAYTSTFPEGISRFDLEHASSGWMRQQRRRSLALHYGIHARAPQISSACHSRLETPDNS